MGMFNEVICEYPLPVEGLPDFTFQTKDLGELNLDTYRIRADGKLEMLDFGTERKDVSTPCPFTGQFSMCHYFPVGLRNGDGKRESRWVEFELEFLEGTLQSLKVLEDRVSAGYA